MCRLRWSSEGQIKIDFCLLVLLQDAHFWGEAAFGDIFVTMLILKSEDC